MAITRQTIVDNLKTLLQTITVANGYYTALGSNVYLFRAIPMQADELPAVVIFDKSNEIDSEGMNGSYNIWSHTLKVTLQIVCAGSTVDTTVRKLITDIYKALGSDNTLTETCTLIDAVSDTIEIEQESKLIAGASIELNIKYRTKRFAEALAGQYADDITAESEVYITVEH